MRVIKLSLLLVFCLGCQFCKKTSYPGDPMPSSSEASYPAGYNLDLYHNRKKVTEFGSLTRINDLIVDSTNKSKAFLVGTFEFPVQSFGFSAESIVTFNSSNNVFSPYAACINPSQGGEVFSLLQSSNGNHYLGGWYTPASQFGYLAIGRKTPSGTNFTYTVNVNSSVYAIKEIGSNIYFTGGFTTLNGNSCASILYFNAANNGVVSELAQGNLGLVKRFEYYNATWFAASQYVTGYISMFDGSAWTTAGDGFNGYVNDLLQANGKLYAGGGMYRSYFNSVNLNFVDEFNGTSWVKTGVNNLPGACNDLEFYNGKLYACGDYYIYYLDPSDNKWKNACQGSSVESQGAYMIKFINGKLYGFGWVLGYNQMFELTK